VQLKIVRRLIPDWGTTYGLPGEGPFPSVITFHGSEGALSGWSHRNAALLAAHGFLAFPFGYFKGANAWNAGNIEDGPLDRSLDALAALRAFQYTSNKLALYGVSRGAEHAVLLTALMAREGLPGLPDAVAAHSPPDVICGAFDARRYRDSGDPGGISWDPAKRAWSWRGLSDGLLPTTPIEIERLNGPLLLSRRRKGGGSPAACPPVASRVSFARLCRPLTRPDGEAAAGRGPEGPKRKVIPDG
jgi:hypothetical protein